MRDFKNYDIWHKSHNFVMDVYKYTTSFPKDEIYGLRSQLRRAASSIPTNIAEGTGRQGDKQFARFVDIASASAAESEYLLILTHELKYLCNDHFEKLEKKIIEIKKMLTILYKCLAN